jgi:membrane associated rhomboid family serine protease
MTSFGVRRLLRRYRCTATVAAVTSALSIPALFCPPLVRALEQNPGLTWHGQPWRLVTPLLVQGYGIWQLVFNLAGVLLVGSAVEQRYGAWRWLAVYAASGVASIAATSAWFPEWVDSGSSTGVAGLIGAVAIAATVDRAAPPRLSMVYSVFFCAYLTALAFGGQTVAIVAAAVVISALLADRFWTRGRLLSAATVALVVASAAALLATGEIHGVGLAAGLVIAGLMRAGRGARVRHEAGAGRGAGGGRGAGADSHHHAGA